MRTTELESRVEHQLRLAGFCCTPSYGAQPIALRAFSLAALVFVLVSPASADMKCSCDQESAVDFSSQESFEKLGYRSWEVFDPATYVRRVYLSKIGDPKGELIYTHGRDIAIALGHHGRIVLINDYFATKGCRVVTASLESGRQVEIDSQAEDWYQRHGSPPGALIIVPEARCLSPDDRYVLIAMELIYISVPTEEEAAKLQKSYKRWWYSVDFVTGQVVQEFRAQCPPRKWWS